MNKYTVFEGNEGVGKTTLAKAFAREHRIEYTNEPNLHYPVCEILRNFCTRKNLTVTKSARELMLMASRSISLEHIVRPAIDRGESMVSDRSFLSGMVYARFENDWLDFEKWLMLARESHAIEILPDRIIYVKSTERKIDSQHADDKYDHLAPGMFGYIDKLFEEALEFVQTLRSWRGEPIQVIRFKNDFSVDEATNLRRLMREIGE